MPQQSWKPTLSHVSGSDEGMLMYCLKDWLKPGAEEKRSLDQAMERFSAESANRVPELPSEILRMIAFHVARHPFDRSLESFINPALYKFRLLSRACAGAGLGVMLTLLRNDEYCRYKTLHLPSEDLRLTTITETLRHSGFINLIDTIDFQPFAVPVHDAAKLEARRLEEIECSSDGGSEYEPDRLRLLEEELRNFSRQRLQQEQWFDCVTSEEGAARLNELLSMLPKRLKLNVEVFEYWPRDTLAALAKADSSTGCFHWKALPIIVRILRTCDISSLTLTGDSSMFHNMSVPEIKTMFGGMDTVHSLTSIRLEMSKVDFFMDATMRKFKPLQAAHSFNAFLACAVNLEELTLSYDEFEEKGSEWYLQWREAWRPAPGDSPWLALVLKGQKWEKLKHFELRDFQVTTAVMLEFLDAHKDTLLHVALEYITDKSREAELQRRIRELLLERGCKVDYRGYMKG